MREIYLTEAVIYQNQFVSRIDNIAEVKMTPKLYNKLLKSREDGQDRALLLPHHGQFDSEAGGYAERDDRQHRKGYRIPFFIVTMDLVQIAAFVLIMVTHGDIFVTPFIYTTQR